MPTPFRLNPWFALWALVLTSFLGAGDLKIHVINVGWGESVLIEGPDGTTLLIDTGKGDRTRSMVIPYLEKTITHLDHFILSHNHDDHGGGATDLVKRFSPAASYYNGSDINTSASFMQTWFAAYPTIGKPSPLAMTLGQVIPLGEGATATCLAVNGRLLHQEAVIAKLRESNPAYVLPAATNNNDTSIVLLVKYKGFDYLYTGDLGGHTWNGQQDFETPIITSVLLSDLPTVKTPAGGIDVLQVGHHGSKTSTNAEFVRLAGPEIGVVSVGPNQSHGLPNKEAINDTLLAQGVKVLQTDEGVLTDTRMTRSGWVVGHVTIRTDGSSYRVDADPSAINTTTQAAVSEYAEADLPWNLSSDGSPASDTTAPTVSASVNGTSGTLTLSAAATDNAGGSGVAKVEFLVDGQSKGLLTVAPYTLALDSRTLTNGNHQLSAKATDGAGNAATSSSVTFTVNNPLPDTTAPTVTASVKGSSGTLTLSATATDNAGGSGVAKVEFLVDGQSKGSLTAAPYTLALDSRTLTNGSHQLSAKATDGAGNTATSSSVTFSVNNPLPDTPFTEVEANNNRTSANLVGDVVTRIVGYFPSASDTEDWFALKVGAGRTLTVDMVGPTSSGQDYDLYLVSSTGTQVAASEGSTTTERVSTRNAATTAKTYYLRVVRVTSYSRVTPYALTLAR